LRKTGGVGGVIQESQERDKRNTERNTAAAARKISAVPGASRSYRPAQSPDCCCCARHIRAKAGVPALLSARIANPLASELARRDRLSPAIVEQEAAKASASGKGIGALTLNFRQYAKTQIKDKSSWVTISATKVWHTQGIRHGMGWGSESHPMSRPTR